MKKKFTMSAVHCFYMLYIHCYTFAQVIKQNKIFVGKRYPSIYAVLKYADLWNGLRITSWLCLKCLLLDVITPVFKSLEN